MIQAIRDRAHGLVSWIAIGFLILMFGMWGVGNYLTSAPLKQQTAATVNGHKITQGEVDQTITTIKRNMRHLSMKEILSGVMLPTAVTVADIQSLKSTLDQSENLTPKQDAILRDIAIEQLIRHQLLYQNANRADLAVSHAQVSAAILAMPWLQDPQTKTFSSYRLQSMLQNLGMNQNQFQQYQAHQMIVSQQNNGIGLSEFSVPTQDQRYLSLLNQSRDFKYAVINSKQYQSNVDITEAQMQTYYQKHKSQYVTPAKLQLSYLLLNMKSLEKNITVTDQEAQQYYQNHQQDFRNQKGKVEPFASVKDQVMSTVKASKGQTEYQTLGNELKNTTFEHPNSLDKAAKRLNLTIQTTPFFTPEDQVKSLSGILSSKKVLAAAWGNTVLKQRYNSDAINISPNEVVVIRVKHYQPSAPQAFAQVKSQIKTDLIQFAAQHKAQAAAQTMLADLNSGKSVDADLTWQSHTQVYRDDKAINSAIISAVFKAPLPNKTKPSNVVAQLSNGDFAVIQVTKAELPKQSQYDLKKLKPQSKIDKQFIALQMAQSHAQDHAFVNLLRNRAEIKIKQLKSADAAL